MCKRFSLHLKMRMRRRKKFNNSMMMTKKKNFRAQRYIMVVIMHILESWESIHTGKEAEKPERRVLVDYGSMWEAQQHKQHKEKSKKMKWSWKHPLLIISPKSLPSPFSTLLHVWFLCEQNESFLHAGDERWRWWWLWWLSKRKKYTYFQTLTTSSFLYFIWCAMKNCFHPTEFPFNTKKMHSYLRNAR